MSKNETKLIQVPILARVEGEGALKIHIKGEHIQTLQLKIYEPPRLFEKFLEGRRYDEVLDIVARICGICPVAYQMSAAHAIEQCFSLTPNHWVSEMRRLFYCGEWIESHSLHIHFLAAPDFLGFPSAPEMAKKFPEEVRRGLRLQALGNELIRFLGGRSVHPVGAAIGGFYKAPSQSEAKRMLEKIQAAITDCEALLAWVLLLPLPDNTQKFTCVSLRNAKEYPMNEGHIVSDGGLNILPSEFENYFKEFQVPYSTALHCLLQGKPYLVGPLARVNLNFDCLPESIQGAVKKTGFQFPSYNMHHSIAARAIEIFYGVLEAERILKNYVYPESSRCAYTVKPGTGYGATEAPRGLLWHKYMLDENGFVQSSRIVPPTSQNQARMECDLRQSLYQFGLKHTEEQLRAYSEMVIRNYDPCISCSTHFLKLHLRRT